MHEETVGSKVVKWLLIGISALFLIVMLLLPLITVISEALRSGWETYLKAVTDRYTIKAILLTLEATICAVLINTIFGVFAAWAVTNFSSHCRFDFCFDIRQTKFPVSVLTAAWYSSSIRCSGHCAGNNFCYIPVHLQRIDSGFGIAGNG